MPTISVIVPVYKVEPYLPRCVDSILAQTFKDFELILVDDGSPDNCGKICDEYAAKDKRVKVIHKENGGVSSARNAGLDTAVGKYYFFCDADDYLPQGVFLNGMEHMQHGYDVVMLGFNRVNDSMAVYESILSSSIIKQTKDLTEEEYIELLKKGYISAPWANLYSEASVGSQRFDTSMVFGEDLCFVMSFVCKTDSICALDKSGYFYYLNPSSVTETVSVKKCQSAVKTYQFLYDYPNRAGHPEWSNFEAFIDQRWLEEYLRIFYQILNGRYSKREKKQMFFALQSDSFLWKRLWKTLKEKNVVQYYKFILFHFLPGFYSSYQYIKKWLKPKLQ